MYELGLRLFREVVLEQKRVQERVQELLLSNIRLERIGEVVDKLLMKNTLVPTSRNAAASSSSSST